MRTILVLTALLLLVPAAAEARTLRGDASSEVLRGTARADVIKGRGGNDRLLGKRGNDRLYGGRGADRFSCGPGRDVVHADMSDVKRGRIAADCEILRGLPAGLDVMPDAPAAQPRANMPAPVTPASRWEPILPGYWFQYEDFPALYRFRADHTGVRTTYPTGNLSFGTPYGFSWQLAGDVVKITFPSGYTDLVTLAAYDSGRDFLTRTSSSTGVGPWYGCRSGQIPDIIAFALCA